MRRHILNVGIMSALFISMMLVFWQLKNTHAQEPAKSWIIWERKYGTDPDIRVTKIQDGSCSLYVVEKSYRAVSVATGQGCK